MSHCKYDSPEILWDDANIVYDYECEVVDELIILGGPSTKVKPAKPEEVCKEVCFATTFYLKDYDLRIVSKHKLEPCSTDTVQCSVAWLEDRTIETMHKFAPKVVTIYLAPVGIKPKVVGSLRSKNE